MTSILSKEPQRAIMTMNVFAYPSNVETFISLVTPLAQRFRKDPECLFCELSQNPQALSHIRIEYGWKRTRIIFERFDVRDTEERSS